MVLAGPIAVGKSTLAATLAVAVPATVVTARQVVENVAHLQGAIRSQLQIAGATIDAETGGRWLGDYVAKSIGDCQSAIVDSARTVAQVSHIRRIRPDAVVVYLDADPAVRAARYAVAEDPLKLGMTFSESMTHQTERDVEGVTEVADIVVDTTLLTPRQVAETALSALRELER